MEVVCIGDRGTDECSQHLRSDVHWHLFPWEVSEGCERDGHLALRSAFAEPTQKQLTAGLMCPPLIPAHIHAPSPTPGSQSALRLMRLRGQMNLPNPQPMGTENQPFVDDQRHFGTTNKTFSHLAERQRLSCCRKVFLVRHRRSQTCTGS